METADFVGSGLLAPRRRQAAQAELAGGPVIVGLRRGVQLDGAGVVLQGAFVVAQLEPEGEWGF